MKNFTRKLKIIDHFKDKRNNDGSILKKTSVKEFRSNNPWINNIAKKLESLEPENTDVDDNVTPAERRALQQLKDDNQIIIKKADKTNIMVVMDRTFYRNKLVMKDHLETETYEKIPLNSDNKLRIKQQQLIERHNTCLTEKDKDIIKEHEWKSANFYVNPKISKCQEIAKRIAKTDNIYLRMKPPNSLKGRPIIAGPESPTKPLSKIMGEILAPLVPLQESYIKDDWDFIKFIPRDLDHDCELLTCDIVSLYTSIPHDLGVKAILYWLHKHPNEIPKRYTHAFIIDSIKFILSNNNFMFNNEMWHQLNGTGMGVDFAGPYACLTVGYLEKVELFERHIPRSFNSEEINFIKRAYKRYVDDGILLWPSKCDIEKFILILNELNDNIKFTIERGQKEGNTQTINFLDIKIILHNHRTIETEIFYKSTNNHHYLDYDSFHPKHVKDNIPYGMAKKIIVFTSDSMKEEKELDRLKEWFIEKQYPLDIIEKKIKSAKLQGPAPNPEPKKQVIALTSTYSNYSTKNIANQATILLNNCPDEETRNFFAEKQIITANRQPKSLLRQLTSAKFSENDPVNPENGIFLCNRSNCNICDLYLTECKKFITSAGIEWEVRSHATCHSKCVIYFLKCAICNQATYLGQTNNFRDRTNNHISSCRTGNGTDIFDKHVHSCNKGVNKKEPLFKAWIMMEVSSHDKLHEMELFLQRRGHDTMNRSVRL